MSELALTKRARANVFEHVATFVDWNRFSRV